MFTTLKLPFHFDPALLKADLGKILPEEWVMHHNRVDYEGGWRGVALHSATGVAGNIVLMQGDDRGGADTPLLARCDYFRRVLSEFPCPMKSVRLMALAPQSYILEHADRDLRYEEGELRVHIPIQTNPGVAFYVSGERLLLEEGSAYYLNAHLPHRVTNRGTSERVHLVIDACVNDWVHALFQRAATEDWSVPRTPPDERFGDFRKLVLKNVALQEELRPISSPQDLWRATCRLGQENGLDFAPADVDAAIKSAHRKEMPRTVDLAPPENAPEVLRNWVPARVRFRESQPIVEWSYLGDRPFAEPFFEDTLRRSPHALFASVFPHYTSLELIDELDAAEPGLLPSGFIFHMSRCGSTLVSQMLAALPRNRMISEAPPIDNVLQANLEVPSLSNEEHVKWVQRMVLALGRCQSAGSQAGSAAGKQHYFIKLDCWHIHKLPLIRAAFPETPWLFLFRDPLEVLASHLVMPGLQSVPTMMDARVLALVPEEAAELTREEWCCQVFSRICESALRFKEDPLGLFLDYKSLPDCVWGSVAKHFHLQLDQDEVEKLQERAKFGAKSPMQWTGKDESIKQLKSEELRQRAAVLFEPLYRELQSLAALRA